MVTLSEMSRYQSYKDSEVSWLGHIPGTWEVKKLKFLDAIKMGQSPDSNDCNEDKRGLPFLQGNAEFGIKHPTPKLWCTKPKKISKNKDILFSVRAPVGAINVADQEYVIGRGLVALSVRKSPLNYRKYQLVAIVESLKTQVTGSTFDAISVDDLKNLFVAQAPLEEQTKIVEFLDTKTAKIDEAVAIKEQQISLLKERKQIIIQKTITKGLNPNAPMKDSEVRWIGEIPEHWMVMRLKYILDERNERSKSGDEPLFMMSQVHGLVVRADYHEKAEVAASNVGNKIVYKNDLVFNKLKAHLGVFFKSNIDAKGLVSPDYAVYKPKAHIVDLKLLELLFRNPSYIEEFIIRATGIVEGLIRLYTDDLFDILVPIAPKKEQLEILNYIEEQSLIYDQVIELQTNQIKKLKEYKTTLINNVVTGKIKVA